jgi:hypothetical protein
MHRTWDDADRHMRKQTHERDRSVIRSFGHSVIRSFGHSVIRSFGHSVIRSFLVLVLVLVLVLTASSASSAASAVSAVSAASQALPQDFQPRPQVEGVNPMTPTQRAAAGHTSPACTVTTSTRLRLKEPRLSTPACTITTSAQAAATPVITASMIIKPVSSAGVVVCERSDKTINQVLASQVFRVSSSTTRSPASRRSCKDGTRPCEAYFPRQLRLLPIRFAGRDEE